MHILHSLKNFAIVEMSKSSTHKFVSLCSEVTAYLFFSSKL